MPMVLMLSIDRKNILRKWKFIFCFFLIFLNLPGQILQTGSDCDAFKTSVVNSYASKNQLCYTFEERRYTKGLPVNPLISRGKVVSYKEDRQVFYLGTHTYDPEGLKNVKFETVKNQFYFGTNCFLENFFKDYKTLPENKRFYAYRNSPEDLLKPDTFLRSIFYHPKYHSRLSITSDSLYRLELTDTNLHAFTNIEGNRTKSIRVYYILKKDYSIVKYALHTFFTVGDLETRDSVIYTYSYYNLPFKDVKQEVNHFIPLGGEKPAMPKTTLNDSITVFPDYHLPDTSGKIKEINSRYVLVDFWYKTCEPCLANMKQLDKLKFKDVEIVTINIRDTVDNDIKQIVSKHNYTFLFKGQGLNKQLRLYAYPTMILYDEHRKILYKHTGFGNIEELSEVLKKLSSGE